MSATERALRAALERATANRDRITRMTLQTAPRVAAMRAAEQARTNLEHHLRTGSTS